MSLMERSNWKDPSNPRRMRIIIPLAIALVVVVGVVVAFNSKIGLTAFGGSPGCPSASASPSASPTAGHKRGRLPGRRLPKGAEAVKANATPAAAPTAPPGIPQAGSKPPATGTPPSANALAATPLPNPSAPPSTGAAEPSTGTSAGPTIGTSAEPSTNPNPSTNPSAGTSADPSTNPSMGSAEPSTSTSPTSCPSPSGGTAADPNPNCTLVVPANPLSAQGLATPYRMTATDSAQGACKESDTAQSAFVQATIIDPATGKLSVYDPLVVDQGARPAVQPVTPRLPARAVVGIWFGYNADNLTLRDTNGSLRQGKCVNGLNGSVFGQYAYCNAPAFFTAANAAITAKKLTVPALGTASDGMPCMSTRDFALIDQDQSDNVTTQYLTTADGRTAQSTAANKARMANAQKLANPSDNALLDAFVDPALGCKPWTAPDLADNGAMVTSLAMDELQANAHQGAPSALIPLNNPMTLANEMFSTAKTNLYRAGVDQPALPAGQTPTDYCRNMDTMQAARLQKDMQVLAAQGSPAPTEADSLYTFMGMRLQQSFDNLKCDNFGLTNPVSKLDMKGDVVVGVTFADAAPGDPGTPAPGTPAPGDPGTPCPSMTPLPTPTAKAGAGAAPSPTATGCATPSPTPKGGRPRHGGRPPHG
jgi:hypothetical protein